MLSRSITVKWLFLGICVFLTNSIVIYGQIRVEAFFGTNEPVVDVFWIKPIDQSSFLYLNRNKFLLPDYNSESPRFSSLNVLAYQLKKTGLGIAIATTTTNAEFHGRGGLQFLKVKPEKWLLYSILSSKLGDNSDVRGLIIAQFTPEITKKIHWFNRVEWITAVGYNDQHRFSQGIIREGIQMDKWQFGIGLELLWLGSKIAFSQENWGVFLAHIF